LKIISITLAGLCGWVVANAAYLPPIIVIRSSTITWESMGNDQIVQSNETITCSIALQNSGQSNVNDVVATLLSGSGITPISTPQYYGALTTNGAPVSRDFTFTVTGPVGRAVQARLSFSSGGSEIGAAVFDIPVGDNIFVYRHWSKIEVPVDRVATKGPASEYPSIISVSGLNGTVVSARVTLHNYEHEFLEDINALLVSPVGTNVMLMSDCGGSSTATNLNLVFDSTITNWLPTMNGIVSGTYSASDYNYPNSMEAPARTTPPYGTYLDQFKRTNPNGDWKLYLYDTLYADVGAVHGGWSLTLTIQRPPTFAVYNNGDGRVRLALSNLGGRSFLIDYSTNMVDWLLLGQVSGNSDPAVFYDSFTGKERRFYRARRNTP